MEEQVLYYKIYQNKNQSLLLQMMSCQEIIKLSLLINWLVKVIFLVLSQSRILRHVYKKLIGFQKLDLRKSIIDLKDVFQMKLCLEINDMLLIQFLLLSFMRALLYRYNQHIMRKRIFLPTKQQLNDVRQFLEPELKPLSSIIPSQIQLDEQLTIFCQQTFIVKDPNPPIPHTACEEGKKFIDVLNENVRQLLLSSNNNYVQCFGQEYKDYNLYTKNLNFGKTILETSLMERLSQTLGLEWTKQVIYNYAIILKYDQDYFQVTGMQLPDQLKKSLDKKKKQGAKNNFSYSTEIINRFQMLYCSHANRNSGLFRKNIFFDKGVRKSNYFQEVKLLVEKQIASMLPNKILKEKQVIELNALIFQFFNKVRDMFEVKKRNNKITCQFDSLLARFCPLPSDYQKIKADVNNYIKLGQGNSEHLFEKMYACESNYREVYQLLKQTINKTFPINLLGQQNHQILISMLKQFISMKRYQNYKIEDFLSKMNIFTVPWLQINFNKKYKKQIIGRARKIIGSIITMLFNKLLIPLLKANFYITQKHKQANKLFYYRKSIWVLVANLALKKFSQINLEQINQMQYFDIKKAGTDYPEGKLRLMPKKGTFRPIITFNRKRKVQGDFYKATLNQILSDTQLVLRNLKNILGRDLGYCIFDNKQISKKYDEFIKRWREKGQPKLVYFTLDIKKCYDSIDTLTLVKIIQKTPYIEQCYMLIKYLRLYRNKRPITHRSSFQNYFNLKQRVHASSLMNNPLQIHEQQIPAINIFLAKQKLITREQIIKKLKQLCDGSIIRYRKQMWLQKLGIPQGLNVSGVLCSLYFAYLESEDVKVKDGLLMRLTDDYLYIGQEGQAVNVLTSLLECARKNNFVFNSQKIAKNFYHPLVQNMTNEEYIHWIGKKININTLQIFPAFDQGSDKLAYAMNVNIPRKLIKPFLKNKLKSLLTNHFAAYFKPHLYKLSTQLHTIRLYCRISLSKFFPFLTEFSRLKIDNSNKLITRILELTVHQYLIYACSLNEESDRYYCYHKYLQAVLEEFVGFFKARRSYGFLKYTERVFEVRLKRLNKDLQKHQQTMMISQ